MCATRIALPAILVCALFVVPAFGKGKPKDVFIGDGFPDLTEEEKTFTKVPYAEAAPAVALLSQRQDEWFLAGDAYALRSQTLRRVKILTPAGVEKNGDYTMELLGDWRVKKVEARTVLPDGSIVDASANIFQEKSDSGYQSVRVAFPKVQVGAILDFHMTIVVDNAWSVTPWILQESIPVLHSRYVMVPPKGMRYRSATLRLPPEQAKNDTIKMLEKIAYVWNFENVEALADEANMPPSGDVSQTLFVIPEEYRDANFYAPIAKDWKSYISNQRDFWQEWMKKKSAQTTALAKQVSEGKSTPVEKAEAIRRALKERVRVDYYSDWTNRESTDDVLAKGSGSSGAIAGTAVVMLRAVGVEAQLASIRRRGNGTIPLEFPLPVLLDDMLVSVPTPSGPLYFSLAADIPVGLLPWDCTDVYAVPMDGKAEAPVKIPDFKSADNRSVRETDASLAASGKLAGQSVERYQGVSAERWRRRLRDEDAEKRKATLREHLQRYIPGAQVSSVEIMNLEDDTKELLVKTQWEAEGYATVAGKRLLLNPNLFNRTATTDWAPAERKYEIDLDSNFDTLESLSLKLPEGAGEVTVPGGGSMSAGKVGTYEMNYDKAEGRISTRRHMRLDIHRFPVAAYSGLKRWFADIAASDDKPVVVQIP